MLMSELKKRFPDASTETWHRHKNGGGWVQNTTVVEQTAYVNENALVYEFARVSKDAKIWDCAEVYGCAFISDRADVTKRAHVYGYACVRGDATITGETRVYEDALVTGQSYICGLTQVKGSAKIDHQMYIGCGIIVDTPLFIQGSRFALSYYGEDKVAIGCTINRIDDWLNPEYGKRMAFKHCFSDEQIEEYRAYMLLFKQRYCPTQE